MSFKLLRAKSLIYSLEVKIRSYFKRSAVLDQKLLAAYLDQEKLEELYELEAECLSLGSWELKILLGSSSYSQARRSLIIEHFRLSIMCEVAWSDYCLTILSH